MGDFFGGGGGFDPIPPPPEPVPLDTNARGLAIQRREAEQRRRTLASLRIEPVAADVGVQVK